MSDKETVVVEKAVLDAILEKLEELSNKLDSIEETIDQVETNTWNTALKVGSC